MSGSEISIRQATQDDFQGILDITKGEDLWMGLDYMPFALKNWLLEGESEDGKRHNIVFILNEEIVSFESFYFLNNGETAIRFGFRVNANLRGKGYGRTMISLQLDYLREYFPKTMHTISTMPDINMPDSAFTQEKFGERLVKRVGKLMRPDLKTYKMPEFEMNQLTQLNKDQLYTLIKDGRLQQLIPTNGFNLCWVSSVPYVDEDIQFIVRKQSTVFVDDLEKPGSFSILSHPIPVPCGRSCRIDVWATTKQNVADHINNQLRNLFVNLVPALCAGCDKLDISITVPPEQLSWIDDSLELFGVGLTKSIYHFENTLNRENVHIYVYRDKLYK